MNISLNAPYVHFKTQLDTLHVICKEARYCDFSEMGAGKTLPQSLLAKGLIDDNYCDYVVIVTPKAVLDDWYDVFRKMIPCDLHTLVLLYHGLSAKHRPLITLRPIIITTYENLTVDFPRFMELFTNNRCGLVLDEAHKVRTPGVRVIGPKGQEKWEGSRRTAVCTELAWKARRLYLLTGTPIVNGLKNAFAYINMVEPGLYRSFHHFKLQHFMYAPGDTRTIIAYKNVGKIEEWIATHSIRYLKREIMDLPPVTYITRHLDWNPQQKKFYIQMMKDNIIEFGDHFLEATEIGARLTRLHQIITNPQQLGLDCDSTRFDVLDDDLESIGVAEHKVVIFAHYRHTIDRLKKKYVHLNPAVVYGGTTDVAAQKRKFNEDDTCRLFIAHPMSAGVGINLTVSSHVIFFEYSYDLDSYDQAVARVDRPGQKRAVTVINYGIRGSMELTKILPCLITKKKFSMALLRDPAKFMKFISLDDDDNAMVA